MSSAKERFRRDWEAKFPSDAVPEGLEFLRRPRKLNVLERSLDRCVRRTDELNSQIARQNFISQFILQLMDSATGQGPGDDEEDDDDAALPADAPNAAAGDDRLSRCCLKDADFSSFELIDLDDAQRTCDLDYPLSKKPGTVQTMLDKVKGAGVIRTSWEPSTSDDHADRHKGKPPKCAPKNPNRIGAALAAHTSRHFAGVNNKTSEIDSTAQGGEGAEKSRETEDSGLRKESWMDSHKESVDEQCPSSESILDMTEDSELNKSSDSPQSISKGNRPTRPRRSDLYEEAFPVAKSHLSEHEKAFSDEEHEEESSPLYFNILLFRQQTLDRAKMVYFNDELSSKLEQQARKLSMRCSHSNRRTVCSKGEDFCDGVTEPQLHSRQSAMVAGSGHSDVDEIESFVAPLCAEEKLQMRRALVTSILDSEQDYVDALDKLLRYMQTFKNVVDTSESVISLADIETIFLKIPDLHQIHFMFIRSLRPKVEKWSNEQQVAEIFHQLAEEEYRIAPIYLKNYQKAISTVKKCYQENPQFRTLTKDIHLKGTNKVGSLEELLHKPVVRIQRNTLVLQDLINCTPPGHADFDLLQKTHKVAQKFLNDFENPDQKDSIDYQRYLVKNDIVVEQVMNARKLRHVFLFNDILVCAGQKVMNKQRLTFEAEWSIPLADLSISASSSVDSVAEESKKAETEPIRRKVINLQNDLKVETERAKASSEHKRNWSLRTHTKNVEKIKKKLLDQKGLLILESPNLPLVVCNKKSDQSYCLLLSSDYVRTNWNSAIQGLLSKVQSSVSLSAQDLNSMLNTIRLPRIASICSLFGQDDFYLEEEFLFGSLTITIRNLEGLKQPLNTYCCIEVDSFGHFLMQAKTRVIFNSSEPNWEEDFDVDLEGAKTLYILCYSVENGQNQLIGKNAYQLSNNYLTRDGHEVKILINEMSLSVFIIYRSREQTLKRNLSSEKEGLFGVRLRTVTRREGSKIPLLVTACIEDIESRGMQAVGVYRVSGLVSEIQRLKKAFEKNSRSAVGLLKSADINVVTGLLKLYFRVLPEALFTDALYPDLVKGMSFSDPEAKEKYMLSVIRKLPEPNYSTAIYVMDHLIRVSAFKDTNKMTLQNLATVFGPNLLRPAIKEEKKTPGEMFIAGAQEAVTQVAILQHLLGLRAKSALLQQS